MRKKIKYNYGECEICGTQMQEKLIKQDFWLRGKLVIVEGIPAGVCPRCREKVVKADVGRLILKLIENSKRIAKSPKISVPAVKFDAEEARV
ncbi:MAG: YgiT-type zinc finger protein [Thermodesulfovibrionia bacterium]|jgi:YgiT-type zinc finger domain-containing protein|nr:YgiT-type zinc finger protein [Thermodesulfovibrionia bacterium]